jgi:hypothetical protein
MGRHQRHPGRHDDEGVVPRWIFPLFVVLSLAMVPWIAFLAVELPDEHLTTHWQLIWIGLDTGEAVTLAATGVAVARRSLWTPVFATATGTLLLVDAWFDVVSASGRELAAAVVMAACLELPLAALCFWISRNVEHVLEHARRQLEATGLRLFGRREEGSEG